MTDMRMTSEEKKDFSTPSMNEAPEYPYGLRLRLGPEELTKLGFTSAPSVDTEFNIKGLAFVAEVSKNDGKMSLELQIKDLEVSSGSDKKDESSEKVIYGES